jgi:hypothetical protein
MRWRCSHDVLAVLTLKARDDERQTQHEDDTSRYGGYLSYFQAGMIPAEHHERLHWAGQLEVSDHKTAWGRKFKQWTRSQQNSIFDLTKDGLRCASYEEQTVGTFLLLFPLPCSLVSNHCR